jgi:hypothetical protein
MAKKANKKKVAICFATQDTVKAKTMFSLVHSLRDVDFDYDLFLSIGCDLIGSRTRLVRQAIESGATHMLFIDHDMHFVPVVKPDGSLQSPISVLLSRDKDIIGAPYNFRKLPLKSTATPLSDLSDKSQPYQCQVVATGFMLINLKIFETIEKPWFNFGRDSDAELVWGEDTWLCQQAKKAGFEVWADPTVPVSHIGDYHY